MFKLKYTSSLANQKEKEISELKQRIDRGNHIIRHIQELMYNNSQYMFIIHNDGGVRLIPAYDRRGVPKENHLKF
jgi:hypothetical protein